MTDEKEREAKGVYAKTSKEAEERGRKLGLGGDVEVKRTDGVTKDDGEIKAWEVTGDKRSEER